MQGLKKVISVVLALSVTVAAVAFPALAEDTNIALGKPVTVSVINSGAAESLTDGVTNLSTQSNVWAVNSANAPDAYADIELGLSDINKIVVHHGMNSGTDWLKSFKIQYLGETGEEYLDLADVTSVSANPHEITLDSTTRVKAIRFVSTGTTSFRLREIEVYGTVVETDETPPTVTVAAVETVTAGSSVVLSAAVEANENTISKVEFYDGETLLGEGALDGEIYQYTMENVAEGEHSITARVTYGEDSTVTSAAVVFTAQSTETNLALGGTVTSSVTDSSNSSGASVVDGISNLTSGTNKWFVGKASTMDAWIDIELPQRSSISSLKIYSGYSDTITTTKDKLTDFQVWYSDAEAVDTTGLTGYTLAKEIAGATVGLVEVTLDERVNARHIKIVSKVENNRVEEGVTSDGVRIREIEVYGTAAKEQEEMPPTVTVAAVETVTVGSSVVLNATVEANENTISKVEFYDGETLLGEGALTDGTYQYTMENVAEGEHSITARVTYGTDSTVTSAAVVFTVQSTETNLAFGKAVTLSLIDQGTAEALTDGVTDQTTGNNIWFVNAWNALGTYADVDLGLSDISKIVIYHGLNSGTDRLNSFTVQYLGETGEEYSELVTVTDGENSNPYTITLNNTTRVKNIRIISNAAEKFRIREIEVYGTVVTGEEGERPTVTVDTISSVTAGDTLVLNAVVDAKENTISKVEFYDGETLLGEGALTEGTYQYTMENVSEGEHSISARVTYGKGSIITSETVVFAAIADDGSLFGIAITSPAETESIEAGQLITVKAVVIDKSGTLQEVTLKLNGKILGTFAPSETGEYESTAKVSGGNSTIVVEATADDGTVENKTLEIYASIGKITYDSTFTVEASTNGSDSSSTPNALIDGKSSGDTGSDKWYLNETLSAAANSWATIFFPADYCINKIVLYSGYISRDPAVVNTEANKPNSTAEVVYHYQFEYEKADGTFEVIPGAVFEKTFSGLSAEDKVVTFEFDEIQTAKVRFVAMSDNYSYRIREIEIYGSRVNKAPVIVLEEPANNGIVMAGAEIVLSADITDDENDVQSVSLYVDGVKADAQFQISGSTYTTMLDTTELASGEHSIVIKAEDGYLEEGVSNTITVNISGEADILKLIQESNRENIEENLIFVAEQININLTQYTALSEKKQETVLLALIGKSFTSATELQSFLDAKVKEVGTGSTGSGGASGGGTASSGGSGAASAGGVSIITPQPQPGVDPGTAEPLFDDLQEVSWAAEAILSLGERGIINGVGDGKFEPLSNVTRGQFAKMLIGALELQQDGAETEFSDVQEDHEFYPYIASAQMLSIVEGFGDGTFGMDDEITREDLAVMITRAAAASGIVLPDMVEQYRFSDADSISVYARESVEALQRAGVMNGMGDGTFAPQARADRAMAAQVIYKLMNLKQEGE